MLYSLIFSVALAQFGIFQSPFKQLPGANNAAGMMIFSDGMDSKPAGQMMAAGMLPRYLPVSTDGYDAADMWMYGFHGQTEQDVINAAKMRYPMSAAMRRPENMELLPLWSQIVRAGLNRAPGSATAASASSGDAASSASSADSGSFGPSTSASTGGDGGASASSEGAVSDGTASTDASTSSGASTSTDSGAAAEPAVANGASTSADSGATTATDSGAASTDSGATTSSTDSGAATGAATSGSTNGMPAFNPMLFDFEEFQERMKDMHENMAEGGFFPMQNGGATGNIMPFQGGATGNNMPFQIPQMPTAVSGNAAGSPAGHMMPPFFGQIEEAGDSESAMQGAAMGCLGMQFEATVLCMMKPDQAECNKCAIAGCVWSGSQCFATRMLAQPHRHKHHYLKKAHTAKSNTNAAPTSSDYKPFMIGSAGILFGALLGYAIGARYLSDNKSPLEEKILA